jgi:capsular exopolysaccharide synthesis family protein
VVAPHVVIQMAVRDIDVAPPISGQETETEQLLPGAGAEDVTPTDMAAPMSVQEAEMEGLSPEAVAQDVTPTDVSLPISAQDVETEPLSPEAVAQDATPTDVSLPISAQEAETDLPSPEAVAQDAAPTDVTLPISAQEAETEQLLPEAVVQDVIPTEVAPPTSGQETETAQLSPEAAEESVTPTDVALPISAQEAETEQLSPEAVAQSVTPTDVALPISAQEVEPEQLLPEAVAQAVFPFDVVQPISAQVPETKQLSPEAVAQTVTLSDATPPVYGPDELTAPLRPTQEAAVAKDSRSKRAGSAAARGVTIKLPSESRLVALTDPNSLGAEKFRALVTRLEHLHTQSELKSFQVTSSVIHEGKTLVSGNVAVTLAKHFGSKTLLVEGDLHRPTLATIFGLNRMRGLSHWWSGGEQDLAQYIHKLGDLPLWFLPAGRPCDRPSDILRSARFVKAFEQLASQFEWIVVDSTPILPIVDVNLWSRLVDGTLLVVREGVTPVKALKQGLRALDHPNLIGVVMNEASATNEMKYAGEYYGSPKHKLYG